MLETFSLFSLGVAYGLTICSLTCMPYVAPYIMGTGQSFGKGIRGALAFVSGKILSYSLYGGIAGYLGHTLDLTSLSSPIMGAILVGTGLTLPLINRGCKGKGKCSKANNISLMALGAGSSLIPCPPLAAILVMAAQQGSFLTGLSYGFAFSLGLVFSPIIVGGGLLSMISGTIRQQLGKQMKYVEGLASVILIGMGLKQLL